MVRNCLARQATSPVTHNEPLQMSDLPDTVWQDVSADFYGPLPTGEHLLVIMDEYSRYTVVEVMHSISANSVIPVMDKIFTMLAIPRMVKTDKAPPFNGEQFGKFAAYMGFHHRKITPLSHHCREIHENTWKVPPCCPHPLEAASLHCVSTVQCHTAQQNHLLSCCSNAGYTQRCFQ